MQSLATRPRGRPRTLDVERRILLAAQACFASRGVDGIAMDELARKIGISKTTIYRSFRTKEDLFKAALDHVLAQLPRASELTSGVTGSIEERLLVVAKRTSRLLSSANYDLIRRALASDLSTPLREHIRGRAVMPYLVAIDDFLRHETDLGVLALEDVSSATSFFFALIVGPEALRSRCSGLAFGPIDDAHLRGAVQVFIKGHAR
ncbi:TetR/AcrR family transcriptional regulator [Lysobacter sp. KIS68-7]|uniref:TetR/AcrR family transcriptional regulator n=1 Tax=Lysobacter sp. KIS68-7 TaxID=2904252 RepID=UPI001E3F8DA5|nr:TetR/AcrR family transcriptional regulator [Lysobacter sp. KIS68-7]UHQ19379.1 TetR/AcrR family transcriptional regulator [Lysobacter sp. KIS68-7]